MNRATHPHPIDGFKARVAGQHRMAANDARSVQFEIAGSTHSLQSMLAAKAESA